MSFCQDKTFLVDGVLQITSNLEENIKEVEQGNVVSLCLSTARSFGRFGTSKKHCKSTFSSFSSPNIW